MFKGRKLLIATKHGKEAAIAPILEKEIGVSCFVLPDLDTDVLGTFTGEVERVNDPILTAKNKCVLAMEMGNSDLAVASEGSFGPHPSIPFVPADDEFLVFIDKKNGLEIVVREISTETNFRGSQIKTERELLQFAYDVLFPSHAVIIRKSQTDFHQIVKGIVNKEQLYTVAEQYLKHYGGFYIETDMRAMHNPTRMRMIERLAQKLIEKINSVCPECYTPGFGITESESGLPCALCYMPTRSTLRHIYKCQKCIYTKELKYPNNKLQEDPMFCDYCNP